MIYDLLEYFKDDDIAEKLALDNYEMKDGYYFIIKDNKLIEVEVKNKMVITEDIREDMEVWVKKADYYSKFISGNKSIAPPEKVFHNNNYMTLFFKHSKLDSKFEQNFLLYTEKLKKMLCSKEFEFFREKLKLQDVNFEEVDTCVEKLKIFIIKVREIVALKDIGKGDPYIKLFIYEDINKYKVEGSRYTIAKAFNKNEYNMEINNDIFGVPDVNMTLNSKKPFYIHTTTNYKIPFAVTIKNAIKEMELISFLNVQKYIKIVKEEEKNLPLQEGYIKYNEELNNVVHYSEFTEGDIGHFIKFKRGTSLEITEYDFISNKDTSYNFVHKNYLEVSDIKESPNSSKKELLRYIDSNIYQYQLIKAITAENDDLKVSQFLSQSLLTNLIKYKQAYKNYFYKNEETTLKTVIEKSTIDAIKDLILARSDINLTRVKYALNARLNLLNYFEIEGMENMGSFLQNELESLSEKLNSETTISCETDNEFYFLSGQYARYLISQSKANKVDHSMLSGCVKANTPQKFKGEITKLYLAYSHELSLKNKKLNNLIAMFNSYENTSTKINLDYFLAGLTVSNVLYEKKEDNNEEVN